MRNFDFNFLLIFLIIGSFALAIAAVTITSLNSPNPVQVYISVSALTFTFFAFLLGRSISKMKIGTTLLNASIVIASIFIFIWFSVPIAVFSIADTWDLIALISLASASLFSGLYGKLRKEVNYG